MKGARPPSCGYRRRGQGHTVPELELGLDSWSSHALGCICTCARWGCPSVWVRPAGQMYQPLPILHPHAAQFHGRREAP